jgi:alpha,alpha-trehalase
LCTVGVISGRSREAVQGFLGLDNVIYAGSHGLDIGGPGGSGLRNDIGREFRKTIDSVYAELSQGVKGIEVALVEHTTYSTTVHYRLVAPEETARVEEVVDRVLQGYPNLRKTHGKMVWEIRPRIDWDKGKAVLWILDTLGLDSSRALAFYIGDDVTDEDAFRALKGRGVGILVAETPRDTAATYSLRDTNEVHKFLGELVTLLKSNSQS